ncbi:MAG TPA: GNVR domain-containing protein [Candidatus Aquilonibacter sp.]|nr:GNVR domain-containing protein [Candidatus Aquilonibacter sp.]
MATKEITKQEPRFVDPDLAQELVIEAEDGRAVRNRAIDRFTLLWEKRRFLFRCAAVGFLCSTALVFLIPVRYTSTTRLMPPDQAGQGIASMLAALGKGDLGSIGGELFGMKTSGDLFVGVLHSRTVEDAVVTKFDLRKVYGVRQDEDARKELEGRTDVAADRKSGIITIKVSDHDRNRAAGMAREYVDALNEAVIGLNTSSAHKERVFLEDRLVEVQKDLEAAEKNFSKFASQNTAIDVKEQGRAMIGAAADLEGQLIATETQLEGLQQIYTPNNVRIRALQARIDEYRRQLKKMGGKAGAPAETANSVPADETSSDTSSDLYPSIRQLPILGVTWADLYRNTKVEEAIYETLTKQYELAKVEEARETPSVKVLDPADAPARKSFPPRTLFVALGIFISATCSILWVLAYSRWEAVDPSDPGKLLIQDIARTTKAALAKLRRPRSATQDR